MPSFDDGFGEVCSAITDAFGQTPSEFAGLDPFEALVAVLLARTLGESSWRTALDGLAQAGLLTPERLADAEVLEIRDAVPLKGRSAAAATLAPLKRLARWLVEHHEGRVDALFNPDRSIGWIRGELAAIKGIGLTGADAILLYALKRPSYPLDRATYRILMRHGWLDPTATYDEARDLVVDQAVDQAMGLDDQDGVEVLVRLAHGMEQVGRRFCRASATDCEKCPLESLLPEGGPRGAED